MKTTVNTPHPETRIEPFGGLRLVQAASIHHAAFAAPWDQRFDRDALAELLASPGAFGLMAITQDAEPAGFIIVRVIADEAEIITIAVLAAARRRGVGSALLEAAAREARERRAAMLFLEVAEDNFPARRLYERIGFTLVGKRKRYYDRGPLPAAAALLMRRDLKPPARA